MQTFRTVQKHIVNSVLNSINSNTITIFKTFDLIFFTWNVIQLNLFNVEYFQYEIVRK